jgi:hypothetical protein
MAPWLIVSGLFIGLLALNIAFVLAAREIRRDVKRRFDEVQRQLERRANSIVDHIFNAHRG